MKKLILRILVQAGLMGLAILAAVGVAALVLNAPDPLGIILAFLCWVAIGISWQETSRWVTRTYGL